MRNLSAPAEWLSKAMHTTRLNVKRFKRGSGSHREPWEYDYNVAGDFGVYYCCGEIGAKVFKLKGRYRVKGHKNKQNLQRSNVWKRAVGEYEILLKIQSSGFTPVPICIKAIKVGTGYFPVIFMQHIDGDIDSRNSNKEMQKKKNILEDKYDLYLDDHWGHNFIQSDDGLYFIDFDPHYV